MSGKEAILLKLLQNFNGNEPLILDRKDNKKIRLPQFQSRNF